MPAQAAEVYHDLVKLDPTDSVAVKSEKGLHGARHDAAAKVGGG